MRRTPGPPPRTPEQFIAHFWSRVARPRDPQACWEWQGKRDAQGYGRVHAKLHGKRTVLLAHRLAWIAVFGALAPGERIDRLCDNRACCRPTHLRKRLAPDRGKEPQDGPD